MSNNSTTQKLYVRAQKFSANKPFQTLLKREILRFSSLFSQTIIAPLVTASLYLLIFGVGLGKNLSILKEFSYLEFIIPGLILMGLIRNSFANSASSLFMARYLGYISDFLTTPLKSYQMILAYTIASLCRGFVVGICVLVVSLFFSPISWQHPFYALSIAFIAGFLFSQFGIIAALMSESFDHLNVFTNFIITPLIYLGGLFYPVSSLPGIWERISYANPLFYLIDAFRYGALGVYHVNPSLSLIVCLLVALILFFTSIKLMNSPGRLRQ